MYTYQNMDCVTDSAILEQISVSIHTALICLNANRDFF